MHQQKVSPLDRPMGSMRRLGLWMNEKDGVLFIQMGSAASQDSWFVEGPGWISSPIPFIQSDTFGQ